MIRRTQYYGPEGRTGAGAAGGRPRPFPLGYTMRPCWGREKVIGGKLLQGNRWGPRGLVRADFAGAKMAWFGHEKVKGGRIPLGLEKNRGPRWHVFNWAQLQGGHDGMFGP